ncbi:MAG: MFS transporter [Dehalococcoidia bacterium]|nr:MFS transporter [Dehalococcoidia bacterium]
MTASAAAGSPSSAAPAAGERLPAHVRFAFGFHSIAGNAVSQTWALWLLYFYAPPSDADIATRVPGIGGVDARVALGVALTLARLIEAIDDPLIGYWTDRTKSKWGRRLPFIVFATPFWALFFVLLFTPPAEGESALNLGYLFFLAMAFFLFSNLAGAPFEALLPSIAPRADDRLSIASWQLIFGVMGAVVGLSLSSLIQGWFGFAVMAMFVAVIALTVRYAAAAAVWRYARADATPSTPGFRKAVSGTISNDQFRAFIPSFVLFQMGLQMLTALLPFYVEAVLDDAELFGLNGRDDEGVFTFLLTAAVIVGMLTAMPLFVRLARKVGKAEAYRVAMLWAAGWFPVLFLAGFFPGTPALPQAVIGVFIAGMATAGVFLFPGILTADIVDYDQTRTDTRREAMFYGTQNLFEKLAGSLSPLLFALVLLAGDSASNPLGIRLVGPVAGALVFVAYLSFRRYRLMEGVEA